MSVKQAVDDLSRTIKALSWVADVREVDGDPGGAYSVYLLPNDVAVNRNVTQIKSHLYAMELRLVVSGKAATASNIFTRQKALEDAIEDDRRRSGNAQDTYMGETWELAEETENGFMSYSIPVFMNINN